MVCDRDISKLLRTYSVTLEPYQGRYIYVGHTPLAPNFVPLESY
jgi:hypothetical protein